MWFQVISCPELKGYSSERMPSLPIMYTIGKGSMWPISNNVLIFLTIFK